MTNASLNLNDANVCENLVWSYLNDWKKCKKQVPFQLNRLCDFQKESYSNVSCSHCRFRKTVVSVKSLAVSKTSEKNEKYRAMSMLLCLHSFTILNFLNKKLKDNKSDESGCPTVGFRICLRRRNLVICDCCDGNFWSIFFEKKSRKKNFKSDQISAAEHQF